MPDLAAGEAEDAPVAEEFALGVAAAVFAAAVEVAAERDSVVAEAEAPASAAVREWGAVLRGSAVGGVGREWVAAFRA